MNFQTHIAEMQDEQNKSKQRQPDDHWNDGRKTTNKGSNLDRPPSTHITGKKLLTSAACCQVMFSLKHKTWSVARHSSLLFCSCHTVWKKTAW